MPPKSDLLYNETAATVVMKYSSLETENSYRCGGRRSFHVCAYGFCVINLTDGVAVCYSEVIGGATGCVIWGFCLFSFQWQLVLPATCVILCYIHVRPAGLSELALPWRVTGPGHAAWTLALQCHVQKGDSWTGTLLAEQICAHLSKALWCEQMSLVHNEVQWMKYNPRKCPPSHHWPAAIYERTSSLTSSLHAPPPHL